MKAIRFNASIPRYAATLALGRIRQDAYYSGPLATTGIEEVPEPALVNDNWVKVRTTYGGVCGSDLNLIFLKNTPYSELYATMPFTMGHENAGTIAALGANVQGFSPGDRVVVDPMLSCAVREIDPPCEPCSRGDLSQCLNLREGTIPPGLYLGLGGSSGGSWSEYFVAHQSQLFKVPDEMSDEQALMTEALSVCVHAVMRNLPATGQTAVVYGCGIIGMLTLAALKALAPGCRTIVIARYPFQAEVASLFGADEVVMEREVGDLYDEMARLTGAQVLKPMIGGKFLNGGPDIIFDCVGHRDTMDNAFRMTRPGGMLVIVGAANVASGIDWTPIWFKELTIRGTLCSSTDTFEGKTQRSFQWSLDFMAAGKIKVDGLLTHAWTLDGFVPMIETATRKGDSGCIKQAFKF